MVIHRQPSLSSAYTDSSTSYSFFFSPAFSLSVWPAWRRRSRSLCWVAVMESGFFGPKGYRALGLRFVIVFDWWWDCRYYWRFAGSRDFRTRNCQGGPSGADWLGRYLGKAGYMYYSQVSHRTLLADHTDHSLHIKIHLYWIDSNCILYTVQYI